MIKYDKAYSTGSEFEKVAGYRRAIRRGGFIFVAGTTGFDYATMRISSELETQIDRTFENVSTSLQALGSELADIVQLNWIVTSADDFERAGEVIKRYFDGEGPPQMTLVCGLVDPRMLFEMQATAMVDQLLDQQI